MSRIFALDRNLVNMIAAGEVIERPANAVKELLENSIDSGATRINVFIEDGGKKLITVEDNGCGMNAKDIELAFEPHCTSKIKTQEDLSRIQTMGFRGEALASIASVSHVKAVSRTHDSDHANCIEFDCGDKTPPTPCSATIGTTISVRDLFYKLPARRKFLRTANTEWSHISELFTRIALAQPNIELILMHNNRQIYRLPAGQTTQQRIAQLVSKDTAENLIETQNDEKGIQIYALFSRPDFAKTTNKFQYVFLNNRYIRDKFISHAIKEAYRGLIDSARFPIVFLFLKMPPDAYDVNVHPTKIEVRFYNSNLVHSQVLGCLREKLLGSDLRTAGRIPTLPQIDPQSSERTREVTQAMADFFKKYHSTPQAQFSFPGHGASSYSPADTSKSFAIPKPLPQSQPLEQQTHSFMQIHDSFIICQTDEGFVIIDQHALHERILYENLRKRLSAGKLESQKLLIPDSFDVTASRQTLINENSDLFDKLGIELAPFGPNTVAVQAFPVILSKVSPAEFVLDMLDLFEADKGGTETADIIEQILDMAACKAAIKAGQKLNAAEIELLISENKQTLRSSHCPHGRPTTIKFSLADLHKQFKRT
ncbi:MAG: DNA mismatch repair endonuclease MutL [Phycisphaerae bacterium]|nr:DNA mismatch repair endonuclease MutL [Phycisphaerae bacterium]